MIEKIKLWFKLRKNITKSDLHNIRYQQIIQGIKEIQQENRTINFKLDDLNKSLGRLKNG